VAAARAEVWHALLHRTDVVLDALPASEWPADRALEPPARLAAPWPHTTPLGAATEVVVELTEAGAGTLLDLRHRGLGEGPAWDEAIGGYFAGWLQALAALGLLVESGVDPRPAEGLRGRERYFASGEIPATADAVWRSLTDPLVLERWSDGVLDGVATLEALEGRFLRLTLPACGAAALAPEGAAAGVPGGAACGASNGAAPSTTELTLILRRTPRGTHVALAEYGVSGREASTRWPPMFERLARFLG
jgi:hypothetical protein